MNGAESGGLLLCVDGPVPFMKQKYWCKVHNRGFHVFSSDMLRALYREHTWEQVQLHPLVLQHEQTYLEPGLMLQLVTSFENRCAIKQIVDNVQGVWAGVHQQRWLQYRRQQSEVLPEVVPTWWSQVYGHNVLTDRRKVQAVILDYFATYLEPQFDADVVQLCRHLCAGISIDETFRVAAQCTLWQGEGDRAKKKYVQAPYAVHTAHSSVTQLMCGIRLMPSKAAAQKRVLVDEILRHQAGDGCTRTVYVATDCPPVDRSMLQEAYTGAFGPGAGRVSVGDDQFHAIRRITRPIPVAVLPAISKGLRKVFHMIYSAQKNRDVLGSLLQTAACITDRSVGSNAGGLFCKQPGLPLEQALVHGTSVAPFVMKVKEELRVYTMEEYERDFGAPMQAGQVEDEQAVDDEEDVQEVLERDSTEDGVDSTT